MFECKICGLVVEGEKQPKFCSECGSSDWKDNGPSEEDLDLFDESQYQETIDPSKPQYKVISQKDRFFSAKFNPNLIERALNEYAQEGWKVIAAVTADFGSLGTSRNELLIILEKLPVND